MTSARKTIPVLGLMALAACAPGLGGQGGTAQAPDVARRDPQAPSWAVPGTCWNRQVTPAIIETVTVQEEIRPPRTAADGTVIRPAAYRSRTRQQIVRPRAETWFETPCPEQMTPDFLASVQRALAARGLYGGAVTGRMDTATRDAIRRYQRPDGPDSGALTLETARRLGLAKAAG